APRPVLARLETPYDWVRRFVEMLGRMTIPRVITTADMTAGQAKAQVYPVVTHGQTFLAAIWR
ncbi:MAG TPA: hypothetical protein VGD49_08680, partial [Longimicrobiales bacterium]